MDEAAAPGSSVTSLRRSPFGQEPAPWVGRPSRSRRFDEPHEDGIASAIALLRLAVAAGISPRNAIGVVADQLIGSAAAPFVAIARRLDVGAPLHDALFHDIADLDPALLRVLQVVERADLDGLEAAAHLDAIAVDVSRDRIAALDTASQRLSVQLLFPLVLCILPAFLCLSMIPLVIDVFDGLPR